MPTQNMTKRKNLTDIINNILGNLAPKSDPAIELEKALEAFWPGTNLSVHDPHKGGVLRTNSRVAEEYQLGMATINQKNNPSGEVALSRGIFNRRSIRVGEERFYLISFEAPLLRLKRKAEKDDKSRKVSCDLIGIRFRNPMQLVAIEVKNQSGGNTNADYALLEARAYGQFLQWILEKHGQELCAEIQTCARRYLGRDIDPRPNNIKVEYAVAGPNWYFTEQKKNQDVVDNTKLLLSKLPKLSPSFSGYWILKNKSAAKSLVEADWRLPHKKKEGGEWLLPILKRGTEVTLKECL